MRVDRELIKNLTDDKNLIGHGKSREVYNINNKIYKKTFAKFDGILNLREYELYKMSKASFLCPIHDISDNYRIVEVEQCLKLDDFTNDYDEFELSSLEYYDGDIREVTEVYPELKKYMKGYTWEEVEKFVHDNGIDPDEFYTCFNWGIRKDNMCLCCMDFGDSTEETKEIA